MDRTSGDLETLIESCKPTKKRGRPSHKRQLQEIRDEGKVNLQTADSVISTINLKSILSMDAFLSLPVHCQTQLVSLLPRFDQIGDEKTGLLRPGKTAMSNEYFVRFCQRFQEKLSENKLSGEAIEQAKIDTHKELGKVDLWKLRNYEPVWGKKLISQIIDEDDDSRTMQEIMSQIDKRNRRRTKRGRKQLL